MPLGSKQKSRHVLRRSAFVVVCLISVSAPAVAQNGAKPVMEKWRPKDGAYASLSADFSQRCRDFGDATIDLAEGEVASSEQKCEIVKLTDAAPGTIRLDVSCISTDREEPHKEIVLLKKVDEKTIFYRQT